MDEKNRKLGKSTIENAQNLNSRWIHKEVIIAEYLKGINFYLQILNKTIDDFFALADAYYNIATIYFNAQDYVKAGEHYVEGIKQILQTELDDKGYRQLTELYIDLADACYESFNKPVGDEAMANAIKAFGLIKIKTSIEQEIGDPSASLAHFKKFHDYYEKKLSSRSYVSSAQFANNEHLLGETQVIRQQEKDLFEQFENISIGDIKKIDDSLELMLSQLSVSAQPFSPVFVNQAPSDGAYRDMSMQFLRLAQSHIQKKLVSETIATYRQAISTLRALKETNESDQQIIQSLSEQIEFLSKKPKPAEKPVYSTVAPTTPQHHQKASSVAMNGFFRQVPYVEEGEEEDFDERMDEDPSNYYGTYN